MRTPYPRISGSSPCAHLITANVFSSIASATRHLSVRTFKCDKSFSKWHASHLCANQKMRNILNTQGVKTCAWCIEKHKRTKQQVSGRGGFRTLLCRDNRRWRRHCRRRSARSRVAVRVTSLGAHQIPQRLAAAAMRPGRASSVAEQKRMRQTSYGVDPHQRR